MKIKAEIEATLPNTPVTMDNAYVGAKVMRGPDWKYDNQDGGAGNVGVIKKFNSVMGVVTVAWPNSYEDGYCIGYRGEYDLIFAY